MKNNTLSFLEAQQIVINFITDHFKKDIEENKITYDYCYQISMLLFSAKNEIAVIKLLALKVFKYFDKK